MGSIIYVCGLFFVPIAKFMFVWAFGDMALNGIMGAVTGSEIDLYTNFSARG